MWHSNRGFSLIELMVALVVLGVLAALAAPAFNGLFDRSRADSESGALVGALNLARLEAINRSQNATVAPVDDDDWTSGFTVTLADNTVLRISPAISGATLEEAAAAASIVFNSLGGLQSPNSSVEFTYTRNDTIRTVAVCVVGRVQMGAACQ